MSSKPKPVAANRACFRRMLRFILRTFFVLLTIGYVAGGWLLNHCNGESDETGQPVPLSTDEVRAAVTQFVATSEDAKIGFVRISGEGLDKKPIIVNKDSDFVGFGPWSINVVTREVFLVSKVAILRGKVVQVKDKVTIEVSRISWLR